MRLILYSDGVLERSAQLGASGLDALDALAEALKSKPQ